MNELFKCPSVDHCSQKFIRCDRASQKGHSVATISLYEKLGSSLKGQPFEDASSLDAPKQYL